MYVKLALFSRKEKSPEDERESKKIAVEFEDEVCRNAGVYQAFNFSSTGNEEK